MHAFIGLMWTCFCQGRNLAGVDSDPEETSAVEEDRDFPTIGSGSESSTYGSTKKKKKRPKEKKEKNPRRKRNEEEDEDEDEDEDGAMKVSSAKRFSSRPRKCFPHLRWNNSTTLLLEDAAAIA